MSLTENMDLELQTPLTTPGPTWASTINNNFTLIDDHNHTSGKGATLSQAAITVSGNYAFNTFRIVDAGAIQFTDLTVAPSGSGDLNGIFSVNGDMYWCNSAGTAIQLTSGSGINISSVGTIGGDYGQTGITASAVYSDTTKTFSWTQASGIAAKMAVGSTTFYHESASVQGVTVAAKAATAQYTLSFPIVAPTTTNMLRAYDAAGDSVFKTITTDGTLAVTPSASTYVFSLPQSIHTNASVSFNSATLSSLTLTGFQGVLTAASGTVGTRTLVNADIDAVAAIVDTKLATISTAGKVLNSATTATSANTASAIVARDGNGDVTVRTANVTSVSASSTINATGGLSTNNSLFLKFKTITGVTAAAGVSTFMAHGLNINNIVSVSGVINTGGNLILTPSIMYVDNFQRLTVNATHVISQGTGTMGAGFAITVLITYV